MKLRSIALGALALLAGTAAQAVTTTYGDRATFTAALATSLTDTYEDAQGYTGGSFQIRDNAAMSAVLGQTKYQSTGFPNNNFVYAPFGAGTNQVYCAGCNGSYTLDFTGTSYGDANGVYGVGLDIFANNGSPTYSAFVTFGNGSTANYTLSNFFGLTSTDAIKTIAFGLPNGAPSQGGNFVVDNLTIGSAAVVPEPAAWALMIGGFGLIGGAARRRTLAVA